MYSHYLTFKPSISQDITAGSVSAATAITKPDLVGPYQVRINVADTGDVRVAFGTSTQTVTTSGMKVSAGATEIFTVETSVTHIALIRDSSATSDVSVNVTTGNGL